MAFLGLTAGEAALGAAGIQAAGSFGGGLMGMFGAENTNAQTIASQQQAQQFNAAEASKNRDWQAFMSNTAYQRAMQDMKVAGLNPILAANLGGASTPGGGQASIAGVSGLQNPGAALQQGITTASQAGQSAAVTKAALESANKDSSQAQVNDTTAGLNRATEDRVKQETVNSAKTNELIGAQTRAAYASETSSLARAGYDAAATEIARHDAVTAKYKSDVAARDAWKATNVGQGYAADILDTGVRSAWTGIRGAGSAYMDYIGKPFGDAVGRLKDKIVGGQSPGLVIDMKRK